MQDAPSLDGQKQRTGAWRASPAIVEPGPTAVSRISGSTETLWRNWGIMWAMPDEIVSSAAPADEPVETEDLAPEDREALEDFDPNPEAVTYSGSDFDVEGLVRRMDRGDIVIPTFGHGDSALETARFQRRFVWNRPQMDRFVESLLLGYPIPGIFLVQQADKRYLVLDGQQRLRTLAAFYRGVHDGREFALKSVGKPFADLTYKTLSDEQRRTLDNTFIQATVVKTDGSPSSLDAVYQVFERLNAGGTQLTPHEIRVALYAGPFIEYLTRLNAVSDWRALYGPESPRLRDQELVLRIVALYVSPGTYRRPLKKYLNDFAAIHRNLAGLEAAVIEERFMTAASLLNAPTGPGGEALRSGTSRQVNAALTEAVFVGVARRLDAGGVPDPAAVKTATEELRGSADLGTSISRATADEEAVRTRLAVSARIFARL